MPSCRRRCSHNTAGESNMETGILTEEQQHQWREDGFVILRGALTPTEVAKLTQVVDQMYDAHLRQPEVKPEAGMDRRNVMEENALFVDLMDHPVTFPVVLE